ncbi:MAG: OsmC family protein [Bacteroidota bacterium]
MPVRNANAVWEGDLPSGKGTMQLGSGSFTGNYDFSSRFEEGKGTNPEELLGAAHAGCFSMALAHGLAQNDFDPKRIETKALVTIAKAGDGFTISEVHLNCKAQVEGATEDEFMKYAEDAKKNCPVSKALAGVEIKLSAKLVKNF